jgi:hypothetical protein
VEVAAEVKLPALVVLAVAVPAEATHLLRAPAGLVILAVAEVVHVLEVAEAMAVLEL